MRKKIIVSVAAILLSALSVSAQNTDSKFKPYNRWMVGGELVRSIYQANGFGASGIYGRQFSEIVFLGVGFGVDTYIYNGGESTTIFIHADGTEIVHITPPYRYSFLLPVYADLQVNFSRKKSPFYGEFKLGGALHIDLERTRGTYNTNELELWGGGILLGVAVGKRFALRNEDELSVSLGVDSILWPWYINMPVTLGVRYCF